MSDEELTARPLLSIDSVSRRFGGVLALDIERLEIPRGRLTALIGPNGAGKSTLFNVVTGFERADSGAWSFGDHDLTGLSAAAIARKGLIRTFQATRVIAGSSVLENMLLAAQAHPGERIGLTSLPRLWRSHERASRTRALDLLDTFRLADKRDDDASSLSGGQRRLLEVARSLMAGPTALLLDEPLAGVNPALRDEVMAHLLRLRDGGLTIVFIEHDMDAVMGLSDHVICMAAGQVITQGRPRQVAADPAVIEAYLGSASARSAAPPRPAGGTDRSGVRPESTPLLRVDALTAGYDPSRPIVRDLSAEVHRGEVVAVIGANGAGKSTLLKAIAGEIRPMAGTIGVAGVEVQAFDMHRRTRAGIGYVPQSRNVFPSLTVLENLAMGAFSRAEGRRAAIERVLELVPALSDRLHVRAGALSGGQRQSLAMARALVADPVLLLLDEPSAGLSPQAQEAAFQHVAAIAARGVGVLIVEQNARQCLSISDRGYVLDQGGIALTGRGADLLHDDRVIDLYLGTMATRETTTTNGNPA